MKATSYIKKLLIPLFVLCLCFSSVAIAEDTWLIPATSLTGGGEGALDSTDTTTFPDGSTALVITSGATYHYTFDLSSSVAESSPDVIAPDTGSGRWLISAISDNSTNTGDNATNSLYSPNTLKLTNWVCVTDPEFGATGDGVTNDGPAINLALATGCDVFLPDGDYYTEENILVNTSGQMLFGSSSGSSIITAKLSLTPVVTVSTNATSKTDNTLRGFRVTREVGTVPSGSVGILWTNWNYGTEENIISDRHGYCWHYKGPSTSTAIGHRAVNLHAFSCFNSYVKVENVADLFWTACETGKNGGEDYAPVSCVKITGNCNAITFTDCIFIPRHANAAANTITVEIDGYSNALGIFVFNNCNTENVQTGFTSDATTSEISNIRLRGGRWVPGGNMFLFNAATKITAMSLDGAVIDPPTELTDPHWLRIHNCQFTDAVTLTGGSDAEANLTGNTILIDDLILSGEWDALHVSGTLLPGGEITNSATGALDVYDQDWKDYTPTVTAEAGTFTTVDAYGSFYRQGKIVHLRQYINITTAGTASGEINSTLPSEPGNCVTSAGDIPIYGKESTGYAVSGFIIKDTQTISKLYRSDNSTSIADARLIYVFGSYQVN